MRTIRIKLFKFHELNSAAKQTAIKNYRKFNQAYNITDAFIAATMEKLNYEFTREGHHFFIVPK